MLRFFAKYQKIILVVGGSILMVVFLLPAGGQFLQPDQSKAPIGSVDGRDITQIDLRSAEAELGLLKRIEPRVDGMLQFHEIDALTWVLLMHEARQQGIYYPLGRAQAAADARIAATPGLPQLLRDSRASDVLLAQAIQHMEMFTRLQEMILGAQRPSEPRLAHFARDIRSKAAVRMVPIKAADHVEDAAEPTDAEVKAHFERYKDEIAGRSEPYGFGYRQPNRFKFEYLTVPLKRVATTIKVDDRAGQRYYLEHPSEFYPPPAPTPTPEVKPEGPLPTPTPETTPKSDGENPATEKPADDAPAEKEQNEDDAPAATDKPADSDKATDGDKPTDGDKAATEPTTPTAPPVTGTTNARPDPFKALPYREVRDKVFEKLTDQLARQKRDRIVRFILAELAADDARQQPGAFTTTPEGYREFTDKYTPMPLDAVQKRVQDNADFGVLIDFARIEDHWTTFSELDGMDGVGSASLDIRGQLIPVSQYIASAQEFDVAGTGALRALRLQKDAPSRPVYDATGDAYVFRLVEVSEAHVPTLDEPGIREQVVADLKKLKAYEALVKRADTLAGGARTEGLAKLADEMSAKVVTVPTFTGREEFRVLYMGQIAPPTLPEVGASKQFVDAVFAMAPKVEAAGGVAKAPNDVKIVAIPVDGKLLVAVTELTEYEPIDEASFTQSKARFGQMMIGAETAEVVGRDNKPMGRDAVIARTGFKRPKGWTSEDEASKTPADKPLDANATPTGEPKPGGA